MSELRIARLQDQAEFERCVEIQTETWNYSAGELFPKRAFLLADRIGGHVLGGFDGDRMIAFSLGFPAYRNGLTYIHSQMLAVLPGYRNAGLGRSLKLAQREIALEQGIDLIEWTYDPLEIKNAFFNLSRLGAISRRYVRDFYGPSSSPLQGGLPTDRLYAEWWVRSERAERAVRGQSLDVAGERTVDVPGEIYAWKECRDLRSAEVQERVRKELEAAFAEGFVATGYERGEAGRGRYLLQSCVDGNIPNVEVQRS